MIGIARPTRGLEFAESSDSIERALQGYSYTVRRTWDEPIPDSFNNVTAELLSNLAVEKILYVEEDTVIPEGGIQALVRSSAAIVHIPYWLKKGDANISYRRGKFGRFKDELIWVSLGCTLVDRKVFDQVEYPWFRSGYSVGSAHEGSSCKEKEHQLVKAIIDYGGQDAYFCWVAKVAGFAIAVVENLMAAHLVLDRLGEPDTNNGCHKIRRIQPNREE